VEADVEGVWKMIVESVKGAGRVKRLGTMYLPLGVLKRLATASPSEGRPEINMLDTPDCHHLPKEYSGFAQENGVELWAGGGGEGAGQLRIISRSDWLLTHVDPLPDAELHNVLQEFSTPLGLPQALSELIPLRKDHLKYDLLSPGAKQAGIQVKWVLGYTVLSKARNVVKDKG
jgi:hypothetical protein